MGKDPGIESDRRKERKRKGRGVEGREGGDSEGEVKGLPDQCQTAAYAPDFYSFCRSNLISVTGAEDRIIQGLL